MIAFVVVRQTYLDTIFMPAVRFIRFGRPLMKAIVFHQHGDPSVLRYTDVNEPQLRANGVLVRVRACALNHLDLWVRRGLPGVPIPLPHVPGSDVAGEVASIGSNVDTVQVGQKVVLAPGVTCGKCPACVSGNDNLCPEYTNLGYLLDGGCAEFVRCPDVNCMPYPGELDWAHAAAIPLVFQTTWHMLVHRAHLQPGETVLVLSAGSGVGSAAIQIAKFFGARVIATAGNDEKLEKARQIGADEVIHHGNTPISKEVRRLTENRGVDVVFEHVGTATWNESVKSLANAGRLVTCGATTGYDAKIDLRFLFTRQLSIMGSYMGTKSELRTVLKMVTQGRLKPIVDKVWPIHDCIAAHCYLEKGQQFGKVVLAIS
jgi:NADPH:quinone reductase-like Zn-dependent oxidoreductase